MQGRIVGRLIVVVGGQRGGGQPERSGLSFRLSEAGQPVPSRRRPLQWGPRVTARFGRGTDRRAFLEGGIAPPLFYGEKNG